MHEIRRATVDDINVIIYIEKLAGFSQWHESQLKQSIENNIVWVVELQNQSQSQQAIIAFAIFSYVVDEAELLNIVVLPEEQGKGVAKRLLVQALQQMKSYNIVKCFLEVAVTNMPAIQLYKKLGYQELAIRKNYYIRPNGKEDALLMQLDLTEQHR